MVISLPAGSLARSQTVCLRYLLRLAMQVLDQIVERVTMRLGLGDIAICQIAQVLFVILTSADLGLGER